MARARPAPRMHAVPRCPWCGDQIARMTANDDTTPGVVATQPDGAASEGDAAPRGVLRAAFWLSWLIGLAMLAGVIVAALHWSEERALWRMAERAQPWWMAVAIALQAGTYLAQGEIWRVVSRARGAVVPMPAAFKLSLAKLFIDQALPSAGISGTVVAAKALEQRGVARGIVMASMVIDGVAYYSAYVLALAGALLFTLDDGRANLLFLPGALLLAAFSVAMAAAAAAVAGRGSALPPRFRRIPLLGKTVSLLAEADPALVRSVPLLLKSVALQLAVVLLDAGTLWTLVRSLGETASPAAVFASFMASSLLRTISIVPGGLGVFEAASVLTLQQAGTSVPVALGATLLFRGLSFWFPMAPGVWFARGLRRAA